MRGRLAALLTLTGVLLAAAGAAGPPSEPGAARGRVAHADTDAVRWVEVTPLRWGSSSRLATLAEWNEEIQITDEEAGPAMVCAGGAGSAVHCTSTQIEKGTLRALPPSSGLAVTGRLIEGRDPVAGARVAVLPADLAARRPFTLPLRLDPAGRSLSRAVVSGDQGRFRLPPLAPGGYRLEISFPGGQVKHTEPFRVPDPDEQVADRQESEEPGERLFDLGDLRFDVGLTMELWAWTPGAGPLGGVLVGVSQGEGSSPLLFEGRTDIEGRAALHGLRPDEPVHVSCSAEGYLRYQDRFPQPPLRVECRMLALAAVEGHVESGSQPLAGATVSLAAAGHQVAEALTGEDGHFRIEGLAPGQYRLVAAAYGHAWEEVGVDLGEGEQRQLAPIALTPATMVEGIVQNALDATPVAGASVVAVKPAGALAASTDDEGRFSAPLPEEGPLVVMVAAAGYARREATLAADADLGAEPWTVELDPGGRIRAVVWNEDGESPCAGCTVVVERPGASLAFREGAPTSPAGVAEFGPLAPGRYHVVLEEVQSLGSTVTVRSGENLREAEVTTGRTTEVYFLPTTTVEVRFWPPPPPGWRLSARGSGERRVLDPVSPGIFRVPRHRGEELELSLFRHGVTVAQGRLPGDFHDLTLELPLAATQVVGRLLIAEGAGAVEVEVLPLPSGTARAAWAMTGSEGGFRIPFLPPGAYGLVTQGRWLATFQLGDLETLDLGAVDPGLSATLDPGR